MTRVGFISKSDFTLQINNHFINNSSIYKYPDSYQDFDTYVQAKLDRPWMSEQSRKRKSFRMWIRGYL